jgi:hypothetical protein
MNINIKTYVVLMILWICTTSVLFNWLVDWLDDDVSNIFTIYKGGE